MSAKIDRIAVITGKILDYQKKNPGQDAELRSFLDYYLPTTLKILRAYAQLDAQGISGENINSAKIRIEGMMDKVVEGFEKQLDRLFQTETLDITSDVQVLEQMLKKGAGLDGLEKRKLRIDHLVGQKQYQAALKEYNVLLNFWEEANERGERPLQTLRAAILHNKGMAYVGLMQYADAAECFDQAYHADGSKESLKCMLAAKRMGLDDKEYVSYAATLTGASDLVMEL